MYGYERYANEYHSHYEIESQVSDVRNDLGYRISDLESRLSNSESDTYYNLQNLRGQIEELMQRVSMLENERG